MQIRGLQSVPKELRKLWGDGSVSLRVVRQVDSVRACSACSGDYEDPEATAWSDASEADTGEADDENAEQPEACE